MEQNILACIIFVVLLFVAAVWFLVTMSSINKEIADLQDREIKDARRSERNRITNIVEEELGETGKAINTGGVSKASKRGSNGRARGN